MIISHVEKRLHDYSMEFEDETENIDSTDNTAIENTAIVNIG